MNNIVYINIYKTLDMRQTVRSAKLSTPNYRSPIYRSPNCRAPICRSPNCRVSNCHAPNWHKSHNYHILNIKKETKIISNQCTSHL